MLDVAVAYNRYKFLGHEFLTWLWFVTENEEDTLKNAEGQTVTLEIGNRIVLVNTYSNAEESITIKGDDAGLEEGVMALKKGAVVTEMNMVFKEGDHDWRFGMKGESLNINGLKPPDTGTIETKDDIEGAVLEKVYLYEKVIVVLDALYKKFVELRLSEEWAKEVVPKMRGWVSHQRHQTS